MRLLIACGNSLRQDDGAGLRLGQQLAVLWQANGLAVRYMPVQQLLPELSLAIADEAVAEVWFVDCRVAQDETDTAVQIRRLGLVEQSPTIGHQLSPEMLLLYARTLFDKRPSAQQPTAWQITVPGFQFGHSESLSDICQEIVAEALAQLTDLSEDAVYA